MRGVGVFAEDRFTFLLDGVFDLAGGGSDEAWDSVTETYEEV